MQLRECGGNTPDLPAESRCVSSAQASSDCSSLADEADLRPDVAHVCSPARTTLSARRSSAPLATLGCARAEVDGHCATDTEDRLRQEHRRACVSTAVAGSGGPLVPCCLVLLDGAGWRLQRSAARTPWWCIRGTVAAPDWTYRRGQGQPADDVRRPADRGLIASAATPGFQHGQAATVYIRAI